MGRHAGWIAAAGGLAQEQANDAPHIILFPEITFNETDFIKRVDDCVTHHGYCAIVVSEGLRNADGEFVADSGVRDAFGHAQLGGVAPIIAALIKQQLGLKYHWAVADYLQRAARHIASKTDVDQAYALGRAAVEMALAGKNAVMPTIERVSDTPYEWRIGEARLEDVANGEKVLPRDFITTDGYGITEACRSYLIPLIAGEDYPPYNNGLPNYVRLTNSPIAKQLTTNFELD